MFFHCWFCSFSVFFSPQSWLSKWWNISLQFTVSALQLQTWLRAIQKMCKSFVTRKLTTVPWIWGIVKISMKNRALVSVLVIYICSVETCVRALGHNLLQKEKIPELVQFRWFRYQKWYENYCATHLPTASWTLKEKRKE